MTRPRIHMVIQLISLVVVCVCVVPVYAQNAQVSGIVMDNQEAVIPKATVTVLNKEKGTSYTVETNSGGAYLLPFLAPATYTVTVRATGFQTLVSDNVKLEVGQNARLDFKLQLGTIQQTITVEGGAPLVNTRDASVSTVVDRQFVENIPLNGRSFQSLIALTPGVVVTAATFAEQGQFSVNGQRADANYFTVDGVSANVGAVNSTSLVQGAGGLLPGLSTLGGTQSLASVDAMQEFRVQTSSFAPEFGRTPGGQVSIVTRSGTNQFHGTLFEYLRNDVLDANNWFANHLGLPKPEHRQNDFGGVLGGPIVKDRTFFFFSYEGLRLRQPLAQTTLVPSTTGPFARQSAPAQIQPFLNAFPLPNGPDLGNGVARFNASYSDPGTVDAYSLRMDHTINSKLALFGRWSYSPSESGQGSGGGVLSDNNIFSFATHTLTAGLTQSFTPTITNETRLNYSNGRAGQSSRLDSFGGAVPLPDSLMFPTGFSSANSFLAFQSAELEASAPARMQLANSAKSM